MRKYFILFFAILMLSAGCLPAIAPLKPRQTGAGKTSIPSPPYTTPFQVGAKKIFVQVVSSPKDMEMGLSGRKKLSGEEGMLFQFGQGANLIPKFWMKDMLFDLDIIWIKDNIVVDISKNLPSPKNKSDTLPTYQPKTNVDTVLEVNAGWAEEYKIKIGDEIKSAN